jgi:hypothetical protein
MSGATIQRTEADYQRLCAEVGRLCGEVVTLTRAVGERDAELSDARKRIAALERRLLEPPEQEAG